MVKNKVGAAVVPYDSALVNDAYERRSRAFFSASQRGR